MRHFEDQYYYLKNIRWIDIDKEGVTIQDLERWSEYKLNRLADETRTYHLAHY